VHVVSLYLPPTQYVLRVEPIDAAAWIRIVGMASLVLVAVEVDKLVRRRRGAAQSVDRPPSTAST
jgi:Ca2+-transporting ATPase